MEESFKQQRLVVDFKKLIRKLPQVGHLFQSRSPALIHQFRQKLVYCGVGVFLQTYSEFSDQVYVITTKLPLGFWLLTILALQMYSRIPRLPLMSQLVISAILTSTSFYI